MPAEQIKDQRDRTPFRPCRLHLTDGARVEVVRSAHSLFSSDRHQLVFFPPTGGVWVADPSEVAAAVYEPPGRPARE